MASRYADQQPSDQRKLRCQFCELARSVRRRSMLHDVASKWKLAANDGVDQIVFQNVRMASKERLESKVVSVRVLLAQALKRSPGAIANAGCKVLNGSREARGHIRSMQHQPRKPQHHIQLRGAVDRERRHCRP